MQTAANESTPAMAGKLIGLGELEVKWVASRSEPIPISEKGPLYA